MAGLSPATAETAQGFEEFWQTYAHKQQRAKAKAAWAKLDPPPEFASMILTEAGRWAAHYAEHAVEPRWRVLPHNWLAGENWLQDLPIVHKDSKSAAIANVRGKAKVSVSGQNSNKPRKPFAPITARILTAEVVTVDTATELHFTATDEAGTEHSRVITLEHPDSDTQYEGQQLLARLVTAAGLSQIEDSAELRGRTIVITGNSFTAPIIRPKDEPSLPAPPDPAPRYANPPQPIPSAEPHQPTDWERRYSERQERKAATAAWDTAHPELFQGREEYVKPRREVREISVEQYEAHAGVPYEEDDDDWLDAEQDDAA